MIGQQKLLAQLDDLIWRNKIPRFSIILGERGMEHEDVARYIANGMSADYIQLQDVKVDTIREMIKQAYSLHHLTVYCIPHADDMSVNAKNALLKVIEDVPNQAYFVMCLEDLSNSLATIQSRGIVFRMDQCKPEELAEFARELYVNKSDIDEADVEKISKICQSPGDVVMLTGKVRDFYNYAKYVVDNVGKVSGAEVFKFSEKLALKDEEDKYDVRLFLMTMQYIYSQMCISEFTDNCGIYCSCQLIRTIGHYLQDLRIKGVNRAMLIDNLWLEMRKICK